MRSAKEVLAHPFTFFLSSSKAVMLVTVLVSAVLSIVIPSGVATFVASILSGIIIARIQDRLLKDLDVQPAWIRYLLASFFLSVVIAIAVQVASLLTLLLIGWFWDAVGTVLFWLLQYRLFKRFVLRSRTQPTV
ncbi:MAG: hypothetical protein OWT28_04725 [Firmicutes bacterium]|nr:hypothetical protein [Bacillota bacterium]